MLRFSTSNENKKQEIKSATNIEVIAGIDIEEVDSNNFLEVIKYKALDMYKQTGEEGIIVEDTVLKINGKPVNDIKFRLEEIKDNIEEYKEADVEMIVSVGVVINNEVFVFTESLEGVIFNARMDGFAFDPYFYINYKGKIKSLAELKEKGLKAEVSPRVKVVKRIERYFSGKSAVPNGVFKVDEIKPWSGKYQS